MRVKKRLVDQDVIVGVTEEQVIRIREANRRANYHRKYGLDLEVIEEANHRQQGRCAICGTTENNIRRGMDVDHDHKTGKFRGMLCNNCNTGLAKFKDNPEILCAAAEYLMKE